MRDVGEQAARLRPPTPTDHAARYAGLQRKPQPPTRPSQR